MAKLRPGFLHPTVSRLRSFTPTAVRTSTSPANSQASSAFGRPPYFPETPSHLSAISRSSSVSGFGGAGEDSLSQGAKSDAADTLNPASVLQQKREPFRWTALKNVLVHVQTTPLKTAPKKASQLLGSLMESPTVMAANGLVCIGTNQGRVHIFDFKQQLRSTCGGQFFLPRFLYTPLTELSYSPGLEGGLGGVSLTRSHLPGSGTCGWSNTPLRPLFAPKSSSIGPYDHDFRRCVWTEGRSSFWREDHSPWLCGSKAYRYSLR